MSEEMQWLDYRKCEICGKQFPVSYPDLYTYKRRKNRDSRIRWFCSYSCLRKYDKQNERGKKPMDNSVKKRDQLEVLMGLVEAAKEGKTADEYLISIGYRKPREKYYEIRQWAKENQPALFEELPKRQPAKRGPKPKSDKVRVLNGTEYEKAEPEEPATLGDAMEEMKAAADGFFDQCRDMGLNIPADEPEQKAATIKKEVVNLMDSLEIQQPLRYEDFTVREVEGVFGRYRYSDIGSAEYIDFESTYRLETISLTIEQWKKFRDEQERAALILGVKI